MNITSGQKKAAIIGAAVLLVAGAAFVYFDPLGLDLLGEKGSATAVKPVAPAVKPGAPAPAAQSAAAVPKAAPVPTAVSAAPAQAAPAAPPATPAKAVMPAATPVAAPVAPPPVAVPAMQPSTKQTETIKTPNKSVSGKLATNKPDRPKNLDLRHCLELETPAAIAKCAGE